MANRVYTFFLKLVRKIAMAALIAALALAVYSLWLFVSEQAGYDERRAQLMKVIETEGTSIRGQLDEKKRRHGETLRSLEVQQKHLAQAEKTLAMMHGQDAGALERIFGDVELSKAHDLQLARIERLKTAAQTRIVDLQKEFVASDGALAELGERLAWVEQEELALKQEKHAIEHYLRRAWHEARWLVMTVFFVYLFGSLSLAVFLYYGWAAWISRGRAVQLTEAGAAVPAIGESAVVVENAVWPGEVLWVRKKLLHAEDNVLTRRKKFLLDWGMPISCFAAGLTRLVELRNARSEGERRVVFSNSGDNFAELAVVSVPEGGSFVLRASFLMGLISGLNRPPVIRRHWRLFCWQSWVAGQFGYFEFTGPCRLVVSCVSALRTETLAARDDGKPVLRRLEQDGVIGFSPRMEFKAVRSEGFLSYCRGLTPLFDLQFLGAGVVLSREAAESRGRDNFRARVLKLCGL